MNRILPWLEQAPTWQIVLGLLVENVLVFLFALGLGRYLTRRFASHRVALEPQPIQPAEAAAVLSCVLLNTLITVVGWWMWSRGWVRFRTDVGLRAWLEIPVLLLVMDLAMYVLHRVAHHPWIYPLLHRLHHDYDRPRPLTLFVLNPAETLAFGGLWLVVIWAYSWSWLGMLTYLFLNVVFGVIGHLGVEPFPAWWIRVPLLKNVAGSTFHARHHQDRTHNFGFYTLVWDRLFGTLRSDYWQTFGLIPEWADEHDR